MTVESNYVIAIVMLSDQLAQKTHVSFSTNEKQNQKQSHLIHAIFSALGASSR